MSDGKRFWGSSAHKCFCGYPLYGSPGCVCPKCHRVTHGNNRVITRDIGVIPNCEKARDVWVDVPLDVMQAATAARADKFCQLMRDLPYVEFKNHPFHHTDVTLSPLTNPSARVRQPWDYDFQG